MTVTRECPQDWASPENTRTVLGRNLRVGDVDANDGDVVEAIGPVFHGSVPIKWASLRRPTFYDLDEEFELTDPHWAEQVLADFEAALRRTGNEAARIYAADLHARTEYARAHAGDPT